MTVDTHKKVRGNLLIVVMLILLAWLVKAWIHERF